MEVTFLYFEGCPFHEAALARLRQVMAEEGITAKIDLVKVETDEEAQRWHFVGSPTILVNGRDIDPPPLDSWYGLTCRAYPGDDGRLSPLPSPEMIRQALLLNQAGTT